MKMDPIKKCFCQSNEGTHEDDRTVLYKTKSLDGTKPNTNPKTNPNPIINPNLNPKLNYLVVSCFFRAPSSDLQASRVMFKVAKMSNTWDT